MDRSDEDGEGGDSFGPGGGVVRCVRPLPTSSWLLSLPASEREWMEKHKRTPQEVDEMEVRCTACREQVNHKVEVRHRDATRLASFPRRTCPYFRAT